MKKNGLGILIGTAIALLTFLLGRYQAVKNGIVEGEQIKANAVKVPTLETKVQEHSEKIAVLGEGIKEIREVQKEQGRDIKEILQRLPRR